MVKQRLQMLHSPYRGVWECARGVYRAEGLRAFYRSYSTQVAMNVPFQAVHFVAYEWAQTQLNPARRYSPAAHALAGAAAGALAAAATTPLDVCKTVLNTQVGLAPPEALRRPQTPPTPPDAPCRPCLQETTARVDSLRGAAGCVLRASGPRGFFKGLQARVLYQMPAAAICWLTYESLKHALATVSTDTTAVPPVPTATVMQRSLPNGAVMMLPQRGRSGTGVDGCHLGLFPLY